MVEQDEQRKLQTLLMQIRSYQDTLQEISRQAALTEQAMVELSATLQAIEALPATKESEALIPVGAGVYTKAQLLDKSHVVVAAGAGVHITKTAAEAKVYLEARMKKLEVNDTKLRESGQRLAVELEAANQAAEELYAKLQGQ